MTLINGVSPGMIQLLIGAGELLKEYLPELVDTFQTEITLLRDEIDDKEKVIKDLTATIINYEKTVVSLSNKILDLQTQLEGRLTFD